MGGWGCKFQIVRTRWPAAEDGRYNQPAFTVGGVYSVTFTVGTIRPIIPGLYCMYVEATK